jgi:hypothetical protein
VDGAKEDREQGQGPQLMQHTQCDVHVCEQRKHTKRELQQHATDEPWR